MIQNLLILICGLLIVVLLLTGVVALGLWLILIIILLLLIVLVLVITLVIVILLPKNETISHSLFIRSILIGAVRNHAILKAPITLIVRLLGHQFNRHSISLEISLSEMKNTYCC